MKHHFRVFPVLSLCSEALAERKRGGWDGKRRRRRKAPELPDHVIAVRCQNAAEKERERGGTCITVRAVKKLNKARRQKRSVRKVTTAGISPPAGPPTLSVSSQHE